MTIISNICKLDLSLENSTINKEYVDLLIEMAPKLNDVFEECYFMERRFDCDFLFQETITEDGVCFSFNTFNSRRMFYEELYILILISSRYQVQYSKISD